MLSESLLLVTLHLGWAVGGSGQEPSSVKLPGAEVDLVRLDVVALDGRERPVRGLRAEDFEVLEDGVPQRIVSFEAIAVRPAATAVPDAAPAGLPSASPRALPMPEEGRLLLVFFDDVHLSSVAAERVRVALASYLTHAMRDGDWTTVIAPGSGVWWTARTPAEHRLLPEVIDGLSGHLVRNPFHDSLTEWEAMQVVEFGRVPLAPLQTGPTHGQRRTGASPGSSALEVYAAAQRRIRKTLRALGLASDALATLRGRKSLVMVSEGFILSPSLAREYDGVIDSARRARVAVYFVDPAGLTSGLPQGEDPASPSAYRPPGVMREGQVAGAAHLSAATGGRAYGGNDVQAGFRQALDEASVYYLVGFVPPSTREGEHRISVRALREGVRVRSRDRYFVEPLAPSGSAAERALSAIADDNALPVRATTVLGGRSGNGEVEASLTVDLGDLAGPLAGRRYRFLIEARRADGRRVEYRAESRLNAAEDGTVSLKGFRLLPGLWQIRLVVQDEQTAELGSVLCTVRVATSTDR